MHLYRYRSKASNVQSTSRTVAQSNNSLISAQRADIVDRKDRILATNLETFALYVETRHLVDPRNTANKLADLFDDLNADDLYSQFTSKRKFLWIRKRLSPEQMRLCTILESQVCVLGLGKQGFILMVLSITYTWWRKKEGVDSAEIVGVAGVKRHSIASCRIPHFQRNL